MNTATKSIALFLCIGSMSFAQPSENPSNTGRDVGFLLDQPLGELDLSGKTVPDALTTLGQNAGVKIEVDARSMDILPWGPETKLADLTVRGATLRDVLTQVLDPLGLMFTSQGDGITVEATNPLKRINRRSTWNDLKLLRRCKETRYTPESFAEFNLQYRITSKVDAPKMLHHQLERAGRGSVAQMLEVASASLGWVWFPNEDHIVIRTAQAQIANKLSRRVTCRYLNQPLSRILIDLAGKAEVAINLEPGMMLKLPRSTAQSYTLVLQRSSIRQALESISGETGLEYKMRRDGLYITIDKTAALAGGQSIPDGKTVGSAQRSPYVGKISVPGGDGSYTIDFLLRADELPADVLELREQIIDEYIQRIRRDMVPPEDKAPATDAN